VFADQVFVGTRTEVSVGTLYAARGLGSFIGPFLFARILGEGARALRRGVTLAYVLAAVAFAAFALAPGVAWAALAFGVTMCATSAVWVNSTQLLQLTVENDYLGRLLAVELLGLGVTLVAATLGTATLVATPGVGPRTAGLCIAAVTLAPVAMWLWVSHRYGESIDARAGVTR
jgi:hypothetical protein